MKKCFFLFLATPVVFAACKKHSDSGCTYTESTTVASNTETDSLSSYLTHQGIAASQESSGVFYTLDSLGGGLSPSLCSNMSVIYKGYLLKSTAAFDSTNVGDTSILQLGSLVVGWQKVMPLVKAGGKVTIYIPPTLGYGGTIKRNGDGDIIIPQYSYLKFNIQLISLQ